MRIVGALFAFFMFSLAGCEPDLSDDAIPYAPFSPLTINLNLPEYQPLRALGSMEIYGIGVKGVIVYKVSSDEYHAYEMNCSYQPNSSCSNVKIDASTLFMIDPCCNSSFDFTTGNPTGGPAWRPLRQYATSVAGSTLIISDDIIN